MEDQTQRPEYYTVAECARIVRVNPNTIYRAVERGDFPAVRVGRALRIPARDFDRLRGGTMGAVAQIIAAAGDDPLVLDEGQREAYVERLLAGQADRNTARARAAITAYLLSYCSQFRYASNWKDLLDVGDPVAFVDALCAGLDAWAIDATIMQPGYVAARAVQAKRLAAMLGESVRKHVGAGATRKA